MTPNRLHDPRGVPRRRAERLVSVLAASIGLTAIIFSAAARAQEPDSAGTAPRPTNYYSAGDRISVSTPMAADVIVAGRTVDISADVTGDVLAAGWRVTLSAPAHDDVRAAAGEVTIDAPVTGDVTVAGGDVLLSRRAHIGGRSWITGNHVRIEGTLEQPVRIAASSVQIAGEIRQPLTVVAEELHVLPTAAILAPVTYRGSSEATVDAGARLSSRIAFERLAERDVRRERAWLGVSGVLFVIHLLVAGLLVLFLIPQFEPSVVATLRSAPWKSLLAGFTLLVTLPVAAVVLVLTVFAMPIGFALAAVYGIALFASVLVTAFFVGDVEARLLKAAPPTTLGRQFLLLLAGVLTLAVLRQLLGGLVVAVSILFGFGALTLWAYEAYSHRASAPAH